MKQQLAHICGACGEARDRHPSIDDSICRDCGAPTAAHGVRLCGACAPKGICQCCRCASPADGAPDDCGPMGTHRGPTGRQFRAHKDCARYVWSAAMVREAYRRQSADPKFADVLADIAAGRLPCE